ncbi:MAG TPA: hypothetical protein VMY88_00895 [Acidimicrobiales bacterium]|nr:hypothetical protein [Acidimicrobiales bacterium]
MRRTLTTVVSLLAALGLLIGASPARAGEFAWTDPEGDATGLGAESTPRPPDPELDISKVTYVADGKALNVTWNLTKAAGDPVGSLGRDFDFYFTHDDHKYAVGAQLPAFPLDGSATGGNGLVSGPLMTNNDGAQAVQIPCGCKLRIDDKRNTITFTIGYADLDRAFPGTGKVGPGTKFTDLSGRAARIQGAVLVNVDLTAPADGATFSF